ncbi:MAG: ABC-type glutathione transport system ATPase component, partial [Myxococcota bacterium]
MSLLDIEDLSIGYLSGRTVIRAVESLTLSISPGETVGLVGESGSGKSTAIQGLLRILGPPGVILGGAVRFKGQDILRMDEEALRQLRWEEISLVPQSALSSLNPVLTVAQHISDTLRAHRPSTTAAELAAKGAEL